MFTKHFITHQLKIKDMKEETVSIPVITLPKMNRTHLEHGAKPWEF
jgi:hypothetical protein